MAYNDYGAFVRRNSERMEAHEARRRLRRPGDL